MDRTIDRRSFLKRSAAAGTAAVGLSVYGLGDLEALAGNAGCRWGALIQSSDPIADVRKMERRMGRKFATTHHRLPWTNDLDNKFTRWSVQTNHKPIVSWFARTKAGPVSWRAIADGRHDGWITSQARSLRSLGGQGYMCFHKEPEDEGNPNDYKAAYTRVRKIFKNTGVSGYKWVVVLTAATFLKGEAGRWLPNQYEGIGVDGYNRHRCFGVDWRSFKKIFAPSRQFARTRGEKLYVIEAGCVERNPGEKARWLREARSTVKSWPEIKVFSYNHENTDCNYLLTSSRSAFDAFKAMGRDTYFKLR
ncbi:MAG: twin-arginine translocation signal domain-containing protein [Actinomycetota bacterium]|nr:twin-arginine translocation signal domain-containing protein [Actinomycetota bacterium]MDH5223578.1 twin-arginine translocation signal domain-containing protein [Actinomycetota bacterium]MDH5312954.1 twin-arginine translocation signal domain-containing protein [Actinomycetota bacterium]